MSEKTFCLIVIEISVVFDAVRDGLLAYLLDARISETMNFQQCQNVYRRWILDWFRWDRWHVVKRIAFYTPIIALLYFGKFTWLQIALLAVPNFLFWRAMYKLAAKWE